MHGEREGRALSSPSPSMNNDEANRTDVSATSNTASSSSSNPATELAYLPIGCSVSAKYRGAFCSAQVKAIEKQVKLKVTLIDSNETITIPEEQVIQSASLRIGNTVTIRLNTSNRRQSNDSNSHSHYSRSGLAAFLPASNHDEKQATIKQIIDNSLYTVVFNDGDEKTLRRSSLCLQGVRLYQTQYGQQKILEEIPSNPPSSSTSNVHPSSSSSPSPPTAVTSSNDQSTTNANDFASIVAVQRQGQANQPVFPALVLKRKALADYMWVRSFLDGREYIVHTRDDVQPYHNNPDIQALCRETSKQATVACEKYIKCNQIPAVWQKKKKKSSEDEQSSEQESSSNESDEDDDEDDDDDDDDIDEETTEEKDSFVAQLFAFMDDRGTPINNIPKVQNYDLDLHRLFKIVRLFGGYNKVTKNDQWPLVHIKMGLPDEVSGENGRAIESAYKKYLFAYEDLSKKLGSMNAPSAYFGGRTSLGSESRRSLMRVRQQQQEEEKNAKKLTKTKATPAPVRQRSRKSNESRQSLDTKPTPSTTKKPVGKSSNNRKAPTKAKAGNVISSSSSESESESESETSDDESTSSSSSSSSSSNYDDHQKNRTKAAPTPTTKKPNSTTSSSNASANLTKKIPQPSSTKSEVKKPPNNAKPSSTQVHESKSSKLTITIPFGSKSKTPTTAPTVKKPSSTPTINEEKKKVFGTKIETKSIPPASPKKPIPTSTKTSQVVKPTPISKQTSNEGSKTSLTSNNKTPLASSNLSTVKNKTNSSQPTSNATNNKDRSVSKSSTSSSSSVVKPTKINPPSTKINSDDRSHSVPVKKTKPMIKEEMTTKTIASPSTMKIPKISSSNDATKKSTLSTEKIPKKQISKEIPLKTPKPSESSSTKVSADVSTKSHPTSPTRTVSIEPPKKVVAEEIPSVPATPRSPSPSPPAPPIFSSVSSISEEPITPTPLSSSSSVTNQIDAPPEVKAETPLIFQPIPIPIKESSEPLGSSPSPTSTKRPHPDDPTETPYLSSTTPDLDEQLVSPLKRIRRSMSSQESVDTLSSEPMATPEHAPSQRPGPLTYEEISMNDVLLVTWGTNGTKSYPARCIGKNDEKNELLVHYIKYNPRHDEWIKLDRVIERTDSAASATMLQQRQRRTSQLHHTRQQHLDSNTSSSSTTGSNLNEPIQPTQTQSILFQPATLLTTLLPQTSATTEDEESSKDLHRRDSLEKNKISPMEESDIDDNSQENNRSWSQHLEPISSTDEDALSSTSTRRTSQSDLRTPSEEIPPPAPPPRRTSLSASATTTNTENILKTDRPREFLPVDAIEPETKVLGEAQLIPDRRQSRATSLTTKQIEPIAILKAEHVAEPTAIPISEILDQSHEHPHPVKEETFEHASTHSLIHPQATVPIPLTLKTEPVPPSTNILPSPPSIIVPATPTNRRTPATRQSKRRPLRESAGSKETSVSVKKKTKIDSGNLLQSETSVESSTVSDSTATRSNSTEQQQINENTTTKRCRPTGRRGGKRSTNQQEYDNDDYRSNSPSYVTMRQQLKDMFKHRPSRYNFLDLNNNLTGDERINHLKDRMRECQKVFFNLKSALNKIEKQRQAFLRKQKPLINVPIPAIVQTSSTEILATSTCT